MEIERRNLYSSEEEEKEVEEELIASAGRTINVSFAITLILSQINDMGQCPYYRYVICGSDEWRNYT